LLLLLCSVVVATSWFPWWYQVRIVFLKYKISKLFQFVLEVGKRLLPVQLLSNKKKKNKKKKIIIIIIIIMLTCCCEVF
jgi:hypothetical protein